MINKKKTLENSLVILITKTILVINITSELSNISFFFITILYYLFACYINIKNAAKFIHLHIHSYTYILILLDKKTIKTCMCN